MNGPPVSPLRYYGINSCSKTVVPIAVRQQNTELCSDTGTGLILKRARANNVLEGSGRCRQVRWARWRERRLQLAFENGFPIFKETIIINHGRRDKQILLAGPLRSCGLQFDFHFTGVSNRGIGSIEGTIGKRLRGP